MKRRSLWSAILPLSILAACGPGELVVTAEVERMNPETGEMELRPVENLAIQLLPFDRDHIFDSLTAAADTPEPQMPPELAQARIPGAVQIDFYDPAFPTRLAELDRDATYLLYCRSGARTGQAHGLLTELGFRDVVDVEGGLIAWVNAELPLER